MNCVSNIASIFTCFLFIAYIIGRIITMKKELCFGTERFIRVYKNDDVEHNNEFDFQGMATIEMVSSMAYKSVTVKKVNSYDTLNMSIKSYGKTITVNNISAYDPLYFIIDLPETIPTFVVEFTREDGVKGYYELYASGKTGEIIPLNYRLKHTFVSRCYYFCR